MRACINHFNANKRYLITGAAGFIGFHLAEKLLKQEATIIGFDNINDYYEPNLKYTRLSILKQYKNFIFIKGDIADKESINKVFQEYKPEIVVNLAAQAGIRYSIDNPEAYIYSNIIGFYNIIEACRNNLVEHLAFASSSSVYGTARKIPFSTKDKTDTPISLYAASKKSNEVMAYSYSHLYGIPTTGLRFFTVYGPYGRPDMAYFTFTKAIMEDIPIKVYNNGNMYRDFTYIDDIINGIEIILNNPPEPDDNKVKYKLYNLGNNHPEKLMDFIITLEKHIGKQAKKEYLPIQPGDVFQTFADITDMMEDFNFNPQTSIDVGLHNFVSWYENTYNI